jgi:ribonuclease VapC
VSDPRTTYILDSFAILAYLGGEEGENKVKEILQEASHEEISAVLSLINLGEVMYITERSRGLAKAQESLALIEDLPIEILPADRQAVLRAASIKARYPVAYADAFVIAAAQSMEGIIVTGDPEFEVVNELISIEWVGDISPSA